MVRLGAVVEDALHKRVSDYAYERGIDMKQVIVPALEQYLGMKAEPHLLSRYAKEFSLLFDILEHGTPADIDLTLSLLRRLAKDAKPKRKP